MWAITFLKKIKNKKIKREKKRKRKTFIFFSHAFSATKGNFTEI
jgi:hypothetical protein